MVRTFPQTLMLLLSFPTMSCFSADEGGDDATDGSSSSGELTEPGSDGAPSPNGTTGAVDGTTAAESSTAGPSETSSGSEGDSSSDDSADSGTMCNGQGDAGLPGVNPKVIWVASTYESTVARINTDTMLQQGRYRTGPDSMTVKQEGMEQEVGLEPPPPPSRIAVSLNGDVVVSNQAGGLVKFFGSTGRCDDNDADGSISTSLDGTPLAWKDEECRAWDHTLPVSEVVIDPMNPMPVPVPWPVPVAWTSGVLNEQTCTYEDERIWVSAVVDGDDGPVARVWLHDTDMAGLPEIVVDITELDIDLQSPDPQGLYNFAVDDNNDLWATTYGDGAQYLVRVDRTSPEYETWDIDLSGYGITIGSSGYVFTCSGPAWMGNRGIGRFDPITNNYIFTTGIPALDCVEDNAGNLWLAVEPSELGGSVTSIDVESLSVVDEIPSDPMQSLTLDFAGGVWAVRAQETGNNVVRIDTSRNDFSYVGDLTGTTAYGDMTGFMLANIAN